MRSKSCLTICALALLVSGCVSTTSPSKLEAVAQTSLNFSESMCQGSAITDSPFGNSSHGGDGLTANTAYIICTAKQFNNIGSSSEYWDKHFILLTNINLISYSSVTYKRIGDSTTPFTGVLDGNSKKIINFTYSSGVNNYVGIFGVLGANGVVKNLNLSNVVVSGVNYVGILAGENQGAEIRNVNIVASYMSGTTYVGGLVGRNTSGEIYNSSVTFISSVTSVSGTSYVGGLVGRMDYGKMQDSFVSGLSVSATAGYVGGVVGYNDSWGQIRLCYAKFTNMIGGSGDNIGGVSGYNDGLIYQSYAEFARINGRSSVGGVVGSNNAGLVQESHAKVTVHVIGSGADVGGAIGYNGTGTVNKAYSEGVLVQGTASNIGGLIGRNVNGAITSSYAKVTSVTGTGSGVGGLVGYNAGGSGSGKIESSYAETTTVSSVDDYVGGLIGRNDGGEIKNSYAKSVGLISGSSYVGGMIGSNGSGYLSSDYADVRTVTGAVNFVGGLLGNSEINSNISKCYAKSSGIIGGNASYIGGFVGVTSGQIDESYALPTTITGSGAATYIGGFAGYVDTTFLMNVYVQSPAGTITGADQVGGFVGTMETSTIYNSYAVWTKVKATGSTVGGHVGEAFDSDIYNSFSVADIEGTDAGGPIERVGYFLGHLTGATALHDVYSAKDPSVCVNHSGDCNDVSAVYEGWISGGVTYFYDKRMTPMSKWDFTNYWQEKTSDYPTLR